jgi:large subunit ribosomal protein L15
MKLHNIKPINVNKEKTRVARGARGKGGRTAGRGSKGQKARTGFNIPSGFEGGQTKLIMRLPKIGGFKSKKTRNFVIKTSRINKFFKEGDIVDPESLKKMGLIKDIVKNLKIKILFDKPLTHGITFKNCLKSKKVK